MNTASVRPIVQAEKPFSKQDVKMLVAPVDLVLRDCLRRDVKVEDLIKTLGDKGVSLVLISNWPPLPELGRMVGRAILEGHDMPFEITYGTTRKTLIQKTILWKSNSPNSANPLPFFFSDVPSEIAAAKSVEGPILIGVSSEKSERDRLLLAGAHAVVESLSGLWHEDMQHQSGEQAKDWHHRSRFA